MRRALTSLGASEAPGDSGYPTLSARRHAHDSPRPVGDTRACRKDTIIVSTGVGSTGWIRSIAAMVTGLTREGRLADKLSPLPRATSNELIFVVREPFLSPNTGVSLVTGRMAPGRPIIVTSEMPNGGYIFSDGIIEKAAGWNAGSKVTVSVGDRYVQRVVR